MIRKEILKVNKYSVIRVLILVALLSIIFAACSNTTQDNKQSESTITTNQSQDGNDKTTNDAINITDDAINKNESKYLDLSSDMHIADITLDEDRSGLLSKYGEPQSVNNDDPEYITITYDFAEIGCRKDNDNPNASESIISISSNKLGIEGSKRFKNWR